ncbi:isochorismatase family cysteine hydrolase [Streptomyces sp. NPDC047000]|uniref:cysteine hydrolase family protein n=1 Tax=Streptomyces sp. NPDC047000 TaxID=3155474 RepID=UPI0033D91E23
MSDSALLVMDVQNVIVERYADTAYLDRLRTAVGAARAADLPVIHVVVGFRPGRAEIHPRNKMFGALAHRPAVPGEEQANAIHAAVAPLPAEPVVVKRRVSGFSGSDLDMLLRARGIGHLVLAGIATGGVVLSTVRQAADLDYRLTVLSDACTDSDPEVHRVLTEKVFPQQADVVRVEEWVAGTAGRTPPVSPGPPRPEPR